MGECQAEKKKIYIYIYIYISNYVLKRGLRNKHKFDLFAKILVMAPFVRIAVVFFPSIITRDWLSVLKSRNIYEIMGSKFIKVRIVLKNNKHRQ